MARQLLSAVDGTDVSTEPMDEWILRWLALTAEPLVGQAPRVAAELLRQAVASSPAGSAEYDGLVGGSPNGSTGLGTRPAPSRWRPGR